MSDKDCKQCWQRGWNVSVRPIIYKNTYFNFTVNVSKINQYFAYHVSVWLQNDVICELQKYSKAF